VFLLFYIFFVVL